MLCIAHTVNFYIIVLSTSKFFYSAPCFNPFVKFQKRKDNPILFKLGELHARPKLLFFYLFKSILQNIKGNPFLLLSEVDDIFLELFFISDLSLIYSLLMRFNMRFIDNPCPFKQGFMSLCIINAYIGFLHF